MSWFSPSWSFEKMIITNNITDSINQLVCITWKNSRLCYTCTICFEICSLYNMFLKTYKSRDFLGACLAEARWSSSFKFSTSNFNFKKWTVAFDHGTLLKWNFQCWFSVKYVQNPHQYYYVMVNLFHNYFVSITVQMTNVPIKKVKKIPFHSIL